MNRHKIITYCFISLTILLSCSIRNRTTKSSIYKAIKASSEIETDDIIFENDYVRITFVKEDVLKAIATVKSLNWITNCNLNQLNDYETKIRNSADQVSIFNGLSGSQNNYYGELEGRILEELIFSYRFVIFNKLKKEYEKQIIYSKWGGGWGCCFAGFYFSNKEEIIRTRVFTDLVIVEDCDTILFK